MRIFVGNLAPQTTENELQETFATHGQVSRIAIITDKKSDQPRRFGFVEMDREEEGEDAIAKLHGTLLSGQVLKVKKARPRSNRKSKHSSRDWS